MIKKCGRKLQDSCRIVYINFRLDDFLSGGVNTGEITELCGPVASFKSQLCMQIASQAASHSGSSVLYVDSGNSFDERRCLSMLGEASSSQSQRRAAMSRISTCACFDGFQLLDELYSAKRKLSEATVCREFY